LPEVTVPRALTVGSRADRPDHDHPPADCEVGECVHYLEMMRLRRNLHDGLGPGLAGIMIRADILAQLMTANEGGAEEMLHDLRREAAVFMAEFRRVLANQTPAELEGRNLADALDIVASRMTSYKSLRVDLVVADEVAEVDRVLQVAAFWIVKEALTNVVKHANADNCVIRVRVDRGLRVSVVDNGAGGTPNPGVGLHSMRSRAAELGGWCEVTDTGVGMAVTAHLPEGQR
jgi:two-component system, NarL family, sensor kinase